MTALHWQPWLTCIHGNPYPPFHSLKTARSRPIHHRGLCRRYWCIGCWLRPISLCHRLCFLSRTCCPFGCIWPDVRMKKKMNQDIQYIKKVMKSCFVYPVLFHSFYLEVSKMFRSQLGDWLCQINPWGASTTSRKGIVPRNNFEAMITLTLRPPQNLKSFSDSATAFPSDALNYSKVLQGFAWGFLK